MESIQSSLTEPLIQSSLEIEIGDSETQTTKCQRVANFIRQSPYLIDKAIDKVNWFLGDQIILDRFYDKYIKPLIESETHVIARINKCLDNNTYATNKEAVMCFCAKLIPRVVRPIFLLLYNVIYFTINALVHPLQFLAKTVIFLGKLTKALKNPSLYSGAGAGILGAAIIAAVFSGGFGGHEFLLQGVLGSSLVVFGLGFGFIKAAIAKEKGKRAEAIKHQFLEQFKEMIEGFALGLLVGAILGGIAEVVNMDNPAGQVFLYADDVQTCMTYIAPS